MATPALSNGSSHELKAISGASEAPAVSEENPLSASYQQTTLIFFMVSQLRAPSYRFEYLETVQHQCAQLFIQRLTFRLFTFHVFCWWRS